MRDTRREAETQAEGEAGSLPGSHWDSIPGLPGSRPELKADAQPLSHPGVPILYAFSINCCFNRKIVNGPGKLRLCVVVSEFMALC